jgi:hypothetical protein
LTAMALDDGKATIPQIRDRMYELSAELHCPELARLADATRRRSPCRRAPPRHKPITESMMHAIRQMARDLPNVPLEEIGRRFGIKGGRVSEVLHGYRDGSPFVPEPG